MSNLGRYQLGQEVTFLVLCKNASGVPADPDACPKVDVYSPTGKPVSGQGVPILDAQATTGLFSGRVLLDERFATGQYHLVVRYQVTSHHGSEMLLFEVMPGGGATGQVIALYAYERPQATFLVQQRTTGRIYKGKNPRCP